MSNTEFKKVDLDEVVATASEFWRRFASKFLLAAIAMLAAQWILMPGYVALDLPAHSDLWRYYVLSQEQSLKAAIISPRPLMLVFLHLLKIFKSPEIFFIVLNLPAVMFASSLAVAMEKVWEKQIPSILMGFGCLLIFGMPTFYELNPLDFGGMLAGVVFSLALFWISHLRNGRVEIRIPQDLIIFGVLSVISVETKPTFIVIFPFLPLILYRRASNKKVLLMIVASIIAISCSVAKDLILKSPFIRFSGGSGDPYYVGHSIGPILLALAQYVKCIAPIAWAPVVILSIYLAAKKNRMSAVAIVVSPILVIAPMCLIPSRVLPMYSWFATALLVLSVLCALRSLLPAKWQWTLVLSTAVLFVPTVFGSQPNQEVVPWIKANQTFNRNSLKGLNAILERVAPGERVLIVGRFMPYSPFQNDEFVRLISHVSFDWKIAYPVERAPLVAMSKDTHRMIPQASVDLHQFDRVAIFSSNGVLERFSSVRDFTLMDKGELEATFYCGDQLSNPNLADRASRVMSCLNDIGEFDASVKYGDGVPLDVRNQWTWFMYGRANEGVKSYETAYESYRRAYSIEHAKVFQEAMDSALANLRKTQGAVTQNLPRARSVKAQ